MIALEISDIKGFMQKLLLEQLLDDFLVSHAEVIANTKYTISGSLNSDYYNSDELEIIGDRSLVLWKDIKPFIYSIIKGNRIPSYFKIIFSLPQPKVSDFIHQHQLPISIEQVNGLFMNLLYENKILKCTTGTSLSVFTLDKSLEQLWDHSVQAYFKKHHIMVHI